MAEREAAQVAKRRARDEAAAEMERQKAKAALERQQRLMPKIEVTKPAPAKNDVFSSIFGGSAPAKPVLEDKGKSVPRSFCITAPANSICFSAPVKPVAPVAPAGP